LLTSQKSCSLTKKVSHLKRRPDRLVPEVYAERGVIYMKLCDFSSAISNFKKAISLKYLQEWQDKLN